MNAKLRSMRARMTVLFALFVGLLMLAGGAAVQHREERRAEKRSHEILVVARERARAELDEAPQESLLQVVQSVPGELAAGGLVLVVVDAQRTLWRSRHDAPDWPNVSDHWRVQTLSYKGQTLVLAQDWKPIAEDLRETLRALWQLGAFIMGATTIAAWIVVGKTLSPLNKLAAQAQNASIDALQVRLESPSSDAEMQHLTLTLNDLLGRLEKEAQARGRFYAAASHELRTPIQVLLGQIDVARSRTRTVQSHEEVLAQLQQETERLATLVQELLQLNALEMGQSKAPHENINLAFWLQRALSQQESGITEKHLKVEVSLSDVEIEAPAAHIEILFRNLLENAVKYAKPASPLKIYLERRETKAYLEIWNAYDLPDKTDLDAWFEPFFRPDASRNSQTGGNGLGLSIVAAIARTNGWKVDLRAENDGVMARVCLATQKPDRS